MELEFKKGLLNNLPEERNEYTFYHVKDTKQIYLSDMIIDDSNNIKNDISDYVDKKVDELKTNTDLKLFCIEPITIKINDDEKQYNSNSYVNVMFKDTDTFEIIPTSNNSIYALYSWPGALNTFYDWLEGVNIFDGILFDMNDLAMYEKWNQGHQGQYHVQYAQYVNCIFWSDNAYVNAVNERTNYTLYYSSQMPLCYSTIPENTFKAFYFAYSVTNDPNWSNRKYIDSFAQANWATQVFSYYGARNIGMYDMDSEDFNIVLPIDCRGLMFYAPSVRYAGVFDAINVTNFGAKSGSWRDAFAYCYSLETLFIKNLKVSINVSWSPIDQRSIEFILSNAINTSKITISLSPYTYYRLTDANKTLASEKNITLELIEGNADEDNRLKKIVTSGDGTKFLSDDGTYKDLSNYVTDEELSTLQTSVETSAQTLNSKIDTVNSSLSATIENNVNMLSGNVNSNTSEISLLKEQVQQIESTNGTLQLRAYLFNLDGTYTKEEFETKLSVTLENLVENMYLGNALTIFSRDEVSANISFVIESNYTLTEDGTLNTLTLYWHQYKLWCTLNASLNSDGTYTINIEKA